MRRLFAAALGVAAIIGLTCGPAGADTPKPGGSIVVTFQSDMATLDPMVGYDWANWGLIKVLFDQLLDYVPGTGELTTDLAESFEVSPDGLVYTFKLRQDVKFHNGRAMTAADMKYSLDRMADPATQCPGASYYDAIVGFADAMAGTAPGLAGVTAVDDYTLRIELVRPDAAFLHKLALNFVSAVPREEVEKYGPDFGHNPVGTGAFKMTEWTPGQRIVFVRNPDYYIAGRPLLDQIVFEVGQDPSVAMLRLERGEVDYVADGVPPARFVEVRDNPDNKDKLIEGPQMQTGYVTLNTRVAPFDDVRVRKAVNMAINKDRIIQLINGRAEPANQPLPPAMPGHDNDYAGYAFDPDGAKALLAEAGYPDGFDTEIYTNNVDPNPRITQAIQQDLAAIGVRAEITSLDPPSVIAAGGTEGQAPMLWSGGMAWIADYPDPSGFFWSILGCGAATTGGWNWAWYCNQEVNDMAAAADAMADPAKAAERVELWRQVYLKAMEDAPWIPIFHEKRFTMTSGRIGGDGIGVFTDPVYVGVRYDVVWDKSVQ